jgi:hypothetical protein
MAIAVIGGLVLSTALSLLVVPAFFVVTDGLGARARAWGRGLRRPRLDAGRADP